MHRKTLGTAITYAMAVSLPINGLAAELPDPDIFDGSLPQAQSSNTSPSPTTPPETQAEENNQAASSGRGASPQTPQTSPAPQGQPAVTSEQPGSGSDTAHLGEKPEHNEQGRQAGGQTREDNTSQQQIGGGETRDSERQGTVNLSIFKASADSQSERPRVFSEIPRTSNEQPIDVPDDFEQSTSLQGVLKEIEQQREQERKKVIEQIENDPNRGSEEGVELPVDL